MKSDAVKEIFSEVLKQEETILELYRDVSNKTSNENIKAVLAGIIEDEGRHANNAKKILKILEESE